MKLLTLAASLLLVGTTVAAPGTARRAERAQRRAVDAANGRTPSLINRVESAEGIDSITNKTNVQYSGNWAGAILISTGITTVKGTFIVPSPTTEGSGSAWVGIDGDTCGTAILQTGIDWTYASGSITYDAWYEWFPDNAYNFSPSDISVSAGDSITVTVTADSLTSGTAYINNDSTGQSVSHSFSNEGSLGSLCQTNAEWIVEDFDSGGSQVGFANFGTVSFTGASASDASGNVGTSGAGIIDIQQSGKILTDCSIVGSSGVTCKYV